MERSDWERKLTYFQLLENLARDTLQSELKFRDIVLIESSAKARARGYLIRHEVQCARKDFEDIVKEIDRGLTHLVWRETRIIPAPHFTDTDGPLTGVGRASNKPANEEPSPQRLSPSSPGLEGPDQHVLPDQMEAERDVSLTKGQTSLTEDPDLRSTEKDPEVGQRRTTGRDKDGEVMESIDTGDSTSAWSSLELNMDYSDSQRGTQQYPLVQDVPHTPEALRLHRNTLTMELLWLQQAIGSRKKYLSLKNRLSIT